MLKIILLLDIVICILAYIRFNKGDNIKGYAILMCGSWLALLHLLTGIRLPEIIYLCGSMIQIIGLSTVILPNRITQRVLNKFRNLW